MRFSEVPNIVWGYDLKHILDRYWNLPNGIYTIIGWLVGLGEN